MEEERTVADRRKALESLVMLHDIGNQQELADLLAEEGFKRPAQPTVARDLQVVGIWKPPGSKYYTFKEDTLRDRKRALLGRMLATSGMEVEDNPIPLMLSTDPGFARGLGPLIEDFFDGDQVIGAISGDDWVLILARDEEAKQKVEQTLMGLEKRFHNKVLEEQQGARQRRRVRRVFEPTEP